MPTDRAGRDGGVRSVDRALTILQAIARHGELPMTEIAATVGVHKSTAFRLLGTLEARGMVERTADRGAYRLGSGVVQLAAAATGRHDLTSVARPVCERLAERVGETVNLAVADGDAVVSVDQVIGTAAVTTVNWVGQRTPMHATAAGKLFLAEQPDRTARRRRPYRRFTEHTIVDPAALHEHLARVREQGYATTYEEHELGLVAVAAPVRSLDGTVVAALVVSGPAYRLTTDAVPDVGAEVRTAAGEISQRGGASKLD